MNQRTQTLVQIERGLATAAEIAAATGLARARVSGALGYYHRAGVLTRTPVPAPMGRPFYRYAIKEAA